MTSVSSFLKLLPAIALLLGGAAAFVALSLNVSGNARLTTEEAGGLIRALWYASGAVRPFSSADAANAMPLYPYLVGLWQSAFGADPLVARQLSIILTVVDAALLFTICRRLTANTQVAAAAVFLFLVTPAAAYFHATAVPVAALTLLHLTAILAIVHSLGRPRLWLSAALGLCFAGMILIDRDALASVLFLGPLFIVAVGRRRAPQAAVLMVVFGGVIGATAALFGERWLDVLRWGPVMAPIWQAVGLAPRAFALIEANTREGAAAAISVPRNLTSIIIDSIVLPYGAAICGALLLFAVSGRALRVLWAVPLYVLWLIGARVISVLSGRGEDLIQFAAGDLAIAALGCALTLAMIWKAARDSGLTGSVIVIGGALLITAANTFAPALATAPDRQFFPAPMLKYPGPQAEALDLRKLEDFIAKNTVAGDALLILHDLPAAPLAATLAGRRISAQSIAPISAYRTLKAGLAGPEREATLAAIEGQGFWTDETMTRWIERDYDAILVEDGLKISGREKIDAGLNSFERIGAISVAGRQLTLYKRKQ
jgi:hypothetical protein